MGVSLVGLSSGLENDETLAQDVHFVWVGVVCVLCLCKEKESF